MSEAIHKIHGIHGPNSKFSDFRYNPDTTWPDGEGAAWDVVQTRAKASWIKLLYPDHTRTDATVASLRGLKVLVRAPGEGIVQVPHVHAMIREFDGVCDVIEVGNEPNLDDIDHLWNHAWYLEAVFNSCHDAAKKAGITLCTPGWRNGAKFGETGRIVNGKPEKLPADLVARLREVYGRYEMIAIHCYDVHRLATPAVLGRVADWLGAFPKKRYVVSEYGIAAKLLSGFEQKGKEASDMEKVNRYVAFLGALTQNAPYVEAAFYYILGGTDGWASFNNGGEYNPAGSSSYWLTKTALSEFGRQVTF